MQWERGGGGGNEGRDGLCMAWNVRMTNLRSEESQCRVSNKGYDVGHIYAGAFVLHWCSYPNVAASPVQNPSVHTLH